MVKGSWQFNTVVAVLFISTSLALVQRCEKDHFCGSCYDRSLLVERDDLSAKERGWDVKGQRILLDRCWENNWRRTGREDVTQDRLLRAEWHSGRNSIVEQVPHVDNADLELLDSSIVLNEDESGTGRQGLRQESRGLGEAAQRQEYLRREAERIPERYERVIWERASRRNEHRLTYKHEDQRRERIVREERISQQSERPTQDQVQRQGEERISDSHRIRLRRSTGLGLNQNDRLSQDRFDITVKGSEVLIGRYGVQKDARASRAQLEGVDRVTISGDRRECTSGRLVRSESTKDPRKDFREQDDTRLLVSRDNEIRLEDATEKREQRVREETDRQVDFRERGLVRVRAQRHEDFRRGEGSALRKFDTRREADSQRDRRQEINSRRQISRDNRLRSDDSTERQKERIRETLLADRRQCAFDRLSNGRHEHLAGSEDRREDSRELFDGEVARRAIAREQFIRTNRDDSDIDRSEEERVDRVDSRRDIARESRYRLKDASGRRLERNSEVDPADRIERSLDRISNKRRENSVRSEERQEDSRERLDREDAIQEKSIRTNRDNSDIDRSEERIDRVGSRRYITNGLGRLLDQRREELPQSEDRPKDSQNLLERENSRIRVIVREQSIRKIPRDDSRGRDTDRLEDRTDRATRVEGRRDISREIRNRIDDTTERREGRTIVAGRLERSLHRLSDQRYDHLTQSDNRRENSERRVDREYARQVTTREENIRSLRRDDSRYRDTDRLEKRTNRVDRQIAREEQDRLNDLAERHEERDTEQLYRTTARREERDCETERSGRLPYQCSENLARSQDLEIISADRGERALNRKADEQRQERASHQRREGRVERLETSVSECLVPTTGELERLDRSNMHQGSNICDERLQITRRKVNDRDDRSRIEECQSKTFTARREELANTPRKTSTGNTERQVDDAMDYEQTFAKYAKPSLLTAIQGTLLAVVIMKSLSGDSAKFGNRIVFKAIELTGSTGTLI